MRKDYKDMSKQTFGSWYVIKLVPDHPKHGAFWECECKCGKIFIVSGAELRRGKSTQCKSCKEKMPKPHGHSRRNYTSPTYQCWRNMIERCTNTKRKDFKWYGAKGIKVCKRWKDDFRNFLKDMGEKPDNLTIDRINNKGNYTKKNCRWATRIEQRKNQSN